MTKQTNSEGNRWEVGTHERGQTILGYGVVDTHSMRIVSEHPTRAEAEQEVERRRKGEL